MAAAKKIIAAMSGGVDSTVAAAVYREKGYEVIGVTLRLKHPDPEFSAAQTCASKNDEDAVLTAAAKLGIEHRFLDLYPDFEDLILRVAWREYSMGRTPNPCTFCNFYIKFGKLLALADELGAARVITGHYARIIADDGIFRLKRGADPTKDQTYFLYRLTQRQLARIRFPVGEMKKTEVRALARKLDLKNSDKKDSQDACFNAPGECFAETLRRLFNGKANPGNFIYQDKIVGEHSGIHQFTVGQRKGLGVALGVPGYVSKIDPESGNVHLTTDNDGLLAESFELDQINWQNGNMPKLPFKCLVQVRYRSLPVPALIESFSSDRLKVVLKEPQRAVTPGQAAVFYDNDFLLGGGVIV